MNGVSVYITFKKSLTETETGLLELSIIVEARALNSLSTPFSHVEVADGMLRRCWFWLGIGFEYSILGLFQAYFSPISCWAILEI